MTAEDPPKTGEWEVAVPAGLCRRCVRLLSRRASDVPGVVSLRVDAARGLLRVSGAVDPEALAAALRAPACARGIPGPGCGTGGD